MVDIADIVTYTNFGDYRLRGFWVAGGPIFPFPIDFHRRPYNTLVLPCECVIQDVLNHVSDRSSHVTGKRRKKFKRSVRGGYYTALSYDVIHSFLSHDQLRAASLIGRNVVT